MEEEEGRLEEEGKGEEEEGRGHEQPPQQHRELDLSRTRPQRMSGPLPRVLQHSPEQDEEDEDHFVGKRLRLELPDHPQDHPRDRDRSSGGAASSYSSGGERLFLPPTSRSSASQIPYHVASPPPDSHHSSPSPQNFVSEHRQRVTPSSLDRGLPPRSSASQLHLPRHLASPPEARCSSPSPQGTSHPHSYYYTHQLSYNYHITSQSSTIVLLHYCTVITNLIIIIQSFTVSTNLLLLLLLRSPCTQEEMRM
jgi:hypothetical protein